MNDELSDVYQMYVRNEIGEHSVCQRCRMESNRKNQPHIGPVPIFHVGKDFADSPFRLLILGAVASGWDEILLNDRIEDPSASETLSEKMEERFYELIFSPSPDDGGKKLFGAIRAIIENIYGSLSQGYNEVAISNVVKCNDGGLRGGAPIHMMDNCARVLMVARREIDALRPRKIISLAGDTYSKYLRDWGLDPQIMLLLRHPAGQISYSELVQRAKEFVLRP